MMLRTYLMATGQSLRGFAEIAGVSHTVVLRAMTGETAPDPVTVARIAAVTGGLVGAEDHFAAWCARHRDNPYVSAASLVTPSTSAGTERAAAAA